MNRFREVLEQLRDPQRRGSGLRNLLALYLAALSGLILGDYVYFYFSGKTLIDEWWVAAFLVFLSTLFFVWAIIAVIVWSSGAFQPNPQRLGRDALISIGFTVLAYAVAYRIWGIALGNDCNGGADATGFDHLYFSAVTFSTLGYGDFRPCPNIRLLAAFQAIMGNLHLGMIVGAAFFFAQAAYERSSDDETDQNADRSDEGEN